MKQSTASLNQPFDVVVCGGGLAGLTLARQLRRELPALRVAVVEPTTRPLPRACHKVGESSVEVGSHYLAKVVELEEYLRTEHLLKNGLRFFCGRSDRPLSERAEVGPSEFPVVPSFQMDRGKLEQDLRAMCEADGAVLLEGHKVVDVELGEPHRVHVEGPAARELRARWLVDATGRRRMLHKKLDLGLPSPNGGHAAWFRVAERIRAAELACPEDRQWHARDTDDTRWLSTIHLMDRGYWVWLIPLAGGYTSVGIVADAHHHDFESFNTRGRALAWIERHEPVLARRLQGLELSDFRVMRNYSYRTHRAVSAERWACVGEAALFVDPLYSPGADFIGLGNGIVTRLIGDDHRGDLDAETVDELDRFIREAADDALRSLSHCGDIFPHGRIVGAKLWWDFALYWAFLGEYVAQQIYRLPLQRLLPFHEMARRYRELHIPAQRLLRAWAELRPESAEDRPFVPAPMFPSVLADMHLAMAEQRAPDEAYAYMQRELETCRQLLTELVIHAEADLGPEAARQLAGALDVDALVPPERRAIEDLPRRERVRRLPRAARDLERALGRSRARAGQHPASSAAARPAAGGTGAE